MPEKVLVIEDEPALCETLAYNLNKEGYSVFIATDGEMGLKLAREQNPDLIILDIMLPIIDGFEVCRILRQEMHMPILMLTARDDEIDRVIGLEMGADDYLTKPFSMRELLAHVKAKLRRVRIDRNENQTLIKGNSQENILHSKDLTLDLERRQAFLGSQSIELKPMEFELLHFLMKHKGKLLSRPLILQQVWGWEWQGESRTVDVHIRWLREKIEKDAANPQRIVTVRGSGYRFEG